MYHHHHNSRRRRHHHHRHILFTIEFMNEFCIMRRKTFTRNGLVFYANSIFYTRSRAISFVLRVYVFSLSFYVAARVACVPGKNDCCVYLMKMKGELLLMRYQDKRSTERERERFNAINNMVRQVSYANSNSFDGDDDRSSDDGDEDNGHNNNL